MAFPFVSHDQFGSNDLSFRGLVSVILFDLITAAAVINVCPGMTIIAAAAAFVAAATNLALS